MECGNHEMIALSQSLKNVDLTIYEVISFQTQPSIIPSFHAAGIKKGSPNPI